MAQALPADTRVVFVTAYDRFALEAFDRGAVDYLLKPVAAERLQRCLARLRLRFRSRADPAAHEKRQLLSTLSAILPAQHVKWLSASSGRRTRLIAVDEIITCSRTTSTRVSCATTANT